MQRIFKPQSTQKIQKVQNAKNAIDAKNTRI